MKKPDSITRKDFLRIAGLGGAAALMTPSLAFANAAKKFQIGSTFILWGYGADSLEPSLADMKKLGYHGFETFGNVIEEWETNRGGFSEVVAKHGVPIISAFCQTDVLDPAKLQSETEKLVNWTKLLKKSGGKVIEYCAGGRRGQNFDFTANRDYMVKSMNQFAKAVTDEGLVCALHPHTGTPVEKRDEVYYIMENVDTRYMKFGPDCGQLAKGGADPVPIFRDFMELIEHVHLKDYEGGKAWEGYCPLGEGSVKIDTLLTMLEKGRRKMAGNIMFELDWDRGHVGRYNDMEAAKVSRDYLAKLGYTFNA